MILQTERLILREVKESDIDDLVKEMNNIKISSCLLEVPHPFKMNHAKIWIKHCLKTAKKKTRTDYIFAITFKEEDKMIGEVILSDVDLYQKKAELAFWLSESHWKKGIVSEAVECVIDFAFNSLKVNRLEMSIFAKNEASNALAKKLGFKYEGTKREASMPESTGELHDDHFYSLLRKEYLKNE